MPNVALKKQVRTTLAVLLSMMVERKLKAPDLARIAGMTPNGIARLLGEMRSAGFDVQYNYTSGMYEGRLLEDLEKSLLTSVAKKIRRVVAESDSHRPTIRLVGSLQRYTVPQFAELTGDSPGNVYNKIIGYKGATLPTGWVAYQIVSRGKWMIQKMDGNRGGKEFTLPENVRDAHTYVIGTGPAAGSARPKHCSAPKSVTKDGKECHEAPIAKGLCGTHYQDARRNPEKYTKS